MEWALRALLVISSFALGMATRYAIEGPLPRGKFKVSNRIKNEYHIYEDSLQIIDPWDANSPMTFFLSQKQVCETWFPVYDSLGMAAPPWMYNECDPKLIKRSDSLQRIRVIHNFTSNPNFVIDTAHFTVEVVNGRVILSTKYPDSGYISRRMRGALKNK